MLQITPHSDLDRCWECPPELSSALQSGNPEQIGAVKLRRGKGVCKFAELFQIEVASDQDDQSIEFRSGAQFLNRLGENWKSDNLKIVGDAGDSLGNGMSGGSIEVSGNVGHGAARGMTGGQIKISGNVGDQLGGPLPGFELGMNRGEIYVGGNVGVNCGYRMRRGLIVIQGNAANGLGYEMRAGSIVVGGKTAGSVGTGMKRGTIILLKDKSNLGSHMEFAVVYEPVFVGLMLRSPALKKLSPSIPKRFQRYLGDVATGMRGEILIAAN